MIKNPFKAFDDNGPKRIKAMLKLKKFKKMKKNVNATLN